jgi:hypothetical protein
MEQLEVKEPLSTASTTESGTSPPVASVIRSAASSLDPRACPTCGTARAQAPGQPPPWVYAIGRIEPRFPRLSLEKELHKPPADRTPRDSLTGRRCTRSSRSPRIDTLPGNSAG